MKMDGVLTSGKKSMLRIVANSIKEMKLYTLASNAEESISLPILTPHAGINFVVKHVNMGADKKKDVYYINGYEYTREDLDILSAIVEPNLP